MNTEYVVQRLVHDNEWWDQTVWITEHNARGFYDEMLKSKFEYQWRIVKRVTTEEVLEQSL